MSVDHPRSSVNPQWKIHACDINAPALHRCCDQIRFRRGDLFDRHFLADEVFEVIISNPPYVSDDQRDPYDCSTFYEPSIALFVHPPVKYHAEII